MDRRERSPGRIFFTEMVPKFFAVPEELRALPERDAIVRVNEFQAVTERLQEVFQMPKEDLEKEGYQTVLRLKNLDSNQIPLTMLEIFDKVKEAEEDPSSGRVPFSINVPDAQNTPQQKFSLVLVNGYARYLRLYFNRIIFFENQYASAIYEVIAKDFPDSSLAQDLELLIGPLQRDTAEEFRVRDKPVTFEEALAEGQSGLEDLPPYNNIIELAELLNKFNIEGELRNKIILYDQNMSWDASVILSYIANGTVLQKEFATFFLEEGKNIIDQLSADEREKKGYTETVDTIFQVLNLDSLNKKFWWMFAPYLFDGLRRNRQAHDMPFDPINALKRILLWAATVKSTTGEETSILGIAQLYISDFRLSSNPQGASHRYVRQQAKWLVEYLLLQNDYLDPDGLFLQDS